MRTTLALGAASLLLASPASAERRFEWLPRLPHLDHGLATSTSDDGCVVAGELAELPESSPWRWGAGVRWEGGGLEVVYQTYGVFGLHVSGDGRVMTGHTDFRAFRWEGAGIAWLPGTDGTFGFHDYNGSALALSRDGRIIVGNAVAPDGSLRPARWQDGLLTLLPTPTYDFWATPPPLVTDVSADGQQLVGFSAEGSDDPQALQWLGGWPGPLAPLPGAAESRALGISSDGAIIVGGSGGRAVRWVGGSPEDLGPGEAFATSTDGRRILIRDGGSLLWDASSGRSALRDVLEMEYGAELAGWTDVEAHDISPDANTLVGRATSPLGRSVAWWARRGEERCPSGPRWRPLVDAYPTGFELQALDGLSATPGGWIHAIDATSGDVVRTRLPSVPGEWPEPPVVVAQLELDPDSTAVLPWWFVESRPAEEVYVGTVDPDRMLRLDPDGSARVVFEGASFPPSGSTPSGEPLRTIPWQLAFAPDGTAFVAAQARALRVDPDGTVVELFDADQAETWTAGFMFDVTRVDRAPDGRLFWGQLGGTNLLVTDADGALLDLIWLWDLDLEGVTRFLFDAAGGLWLTDRTDILYVSAAQLEAHATWIGEDFLTLPGGIDLEMGEQGALYFASRSPGGSPDLFRIQRRNPSGAIQTIYEGSYENGPEFVDFALTHDTLVTRRAIQYEWPWSSPIAWPQLVQVPLPPEPPACDDGLDDDGDGLVDFPDDPGCLSALDTSENAPDAVCDDGEDDDGDGLVDFPDDPGCSSPEGRLEDPACSDGIDNDGDGAADWDGAAGLPPDPQCVGDPTRLFEQGFCGLGYELGALAAGLRMLMGRARRRRRTPSA